MFNPIQKSMIIGITLVIVYLIINIYNPKDSTDPVDGRSGFQLMIDNLTGCQYLKAGYFGGLTPRVDKNGRHICR